jgi:exodeoxyribonuclease-5
MKTKISPNRCQYRCIRALKKWWKESNDQLFEYAGGPGTGKTTIIEWLMSEIGLDIRMDVLFMAYTGKAASVMQEKGLNATTIHSAIYNYVESIMYDDDGKPIILNGKLVTGLKPIRKPFLESNKRLIVVDEGGTVPEKMAKDLLSYGLPVIVMGDLDQLPPVFGKSYFLQHPNFILTEIMRQALDSGIVQIAKLICDRQPLEFKRYGKDAIVIPKSMLTKDMYRYSEQILTPSNRCRSDIVYNMRTYIRKHTGDLPEMGDKLICRKNEWGMELDGIPLINGTIGRVDSPIRMGKCDLKNNIYSINFRPDYTRNIYKDLSCDYEFLNKKFTDKKVNLFNEGMKMEYADAITVHLSQGSQFNSVLYYDDVVGDEEYMRLVRNTAATRARKMLVLAM